MLFSLQHSNTFADIRVAVLRIEVIYSLKRKKKASSTQKSGNRLAKYECSGEIGQTKDTNIGKPSIRPLDVQGSSFRAKVK